MGFGDMFNLLRKRCKVSSWLGHPGVLKWLLRNWVLYVYAVPYSALWNISITLIGLCILIHMIIRLWYVIAASILKIESASFCFIFIFGTTLSFQIC